MCDPDGDDKGPIDVGRIFESTKYVEIPGVQGAIKVYKTSGPPSSPLFFLHHGIGKGALCWTLAVRSLKRLFKGNCTIVCFDCRGHGETTLEPKVDLSLATLSSDLVALVNSEMEGGPPRDLVLVGHSVGGAVVVNAATSLKVTLMVLACTIGGNVVDNFMFTKACLQRQKTIFDSVQDAIDHCSKSMLRKELAEVSVPPLLKPKFDDPTKCTWKINPIKVEKYWNGWLLNTEKDFLAAKVPKLLIVVGSGYLEKDLMISQMRGEFRLEVLKKSGHSVMEDQPDKLAFVIQDAYTRTSNPIKIHTVASHT